MPDWLSVGLIFGASLMAIVAGVSASEHRSTKGTSRPEIAHHCSADTHVIFSCQTERFGETETISICLGDSRVDYIAGPIGSPGWIAESNPAWSNVHLGHVVGGGGGSQSHIRLSSDDGGEFIFFAGNPGSLHDAADEPYAGLYVEAPDGPIHRYECQRPFHSRMGSNKLDQLLRQAAPAKVFEDRSIYEEEGGHYDGWF